MDYLKLNLLQNDAERIEARVTNPRQPLWLSKTRTSRGMMKRTIVVILLLIISNGYLRAQLITNDSVRKSKKGASNYQKNVLNMECDLCCLVSALESNSYFLNDSILNDLYDSVNFQIDFNLVISDFKKTRQILNYAKRNEERVCYIPFIRTFDSDGLKKKNSGGLKKFICDCSTIQFLVLVNLQLVFFENYHIPKDQLLISIRLKKNHVDQNYQLTQKDYNRVYRIYMNTLRRKKFTTNPLRGTDYKWEVMVVKM